MFLLIMSNASAAQRNANIKNKRIQRIQTQ